MFLYRDGDKVEEYEGTRTLEDMYSFVNRNLSHDELWFVLFWCAQNTSIVT